MPTLQELLEGDFGIGSTKTASARSSSGANDEIEKLAKELSLESLFGKEAEEDEKEEDKKEDDDDKEEEDDKEEKSASFAGLDGLYNELYPEDSSITVKTAEEEKNAAEAALGSRAFDYFAQQWDRRIEKLANEVLSGSAGGSNRSGPVQTDVTPPQTQADNKPSDADKAINTKSTVVTDNVKAKNDAESVGHYAQKSAALRKAFILANLEK